MPMIAALSLLAISQDIRVPTGQYIPEMNSLELGERPLDFVVDGQGRVLVKTQKSLVVVKDRKPVQSLPLGGASMHGIVLSQDGTRLYVSDASSSIRVAKVGEKIEWLEPLKLPEPAVKGDAYPCGMAELTDGRLAVAGSRGNEVLVVDPSGRRLTTRIPVDVAPYDVALASDGRTLLVSCWSEHAKKGSRQAPSADTPVPVTPNGIATNGSLVYVDVENARILARNKLGRQPMDIEVSKEGLAYIAEGNNDSVAVVDVVGKKLARRLRFPNGFHGLAPNGLSISPDGTRLYVSLGGSNEVAIFGRNTGKERLLAKLPTQWYPGKVMEIDDQLVVGNLKGVGKGPKPANATGYNVYQFSGTLAWQPIPLVTPNPFEAVAAPPRLGAKPIPVPERLGEPSVFEHVVYILKENRTYDQVFGDMAKGDGDPKLCIYGSNVTPNHHALADQFALLDNYYCNGVNSADGHAWSMEGNVTPYFERSFGGWARSYPFGDDPLSVSASGFLWDAVLDAGKTFRNFGEFNYADSDPKEAGFLDIFRDFQTKAGKIKMTHNIGVERLRQHSNLDAPGWNLKIPDVLRAKVFLDEFKQMERTGKMPNLTLLYLPQDHTSGLAEGSPTPQAQVADNDLAVGQVIQAISHSKFWPKTVIFVIEDDPQDGFDHVDGHRSLCLVVSPYTYRKAVVSEFYNQTSMLRTIHQILGIRPRTLHIAQSPLMSACFQPTPNLAPYYLKPNNIPLDQMNPATKTLKGRMRELAVLSNKLDLKKPDMADEDELNRILWHAAKGPSAKYPAEWAGAHGRGLAARGLAFDAKAKKDEDDEEEDDDD
jgi:DNA-binding beta-propeller fold protein YncE